MQYIRQHSLQAVHLCNIIMHRAAVTFAYIMQYFIPT